MAEEVGGTALTAVGHVKEANNALSLDNLLSPVSISICDIGDDDDAFSRSNIGKSSSSFSDREGESFLLTPIRTPSTRSVTSAGAATEDPFSGDWLVAGENRVSC